jgi:hypothetical protein
VKLYFTIGGLLQALAVAGLLAAPLARPAMAMPTSMPAAVSAVDAGATAVGMPEDMACCPDQAPASDCGQVCPLMALCSAATAQQPPPTAWLTQAFRSANIVIPPNDAQLDSLAHGPPRKPPKI